MTITQLEREIRILRLYAVVSTVVVICALMATARAQTTRQHFTELDVERLNIVEADGRASLVLANTERLPGVLLGGKELPKEFSSGRIGSAGLLFVDAQGNEVGGLTYAARVRADGSFTADGSLTFDQHNQDQVVGLQYDDDGTRRVYGLNVWDVPTKVTIAEMLQAAGDARDRATRHRRFAELLKARGETPGARRVFLGSEDRTAALKIADIAGRDRIRMYVDTANRARLEFLDESGKVLYAIPDQRR